MKKVLVNWMVIIILIVMVFGLFNTYTVKAGDGILEGIRYILHAGNSQEYPENSLPGYRSIPKNIKAAECDIIDTKDNQWVLMHNITIDKTTNGSGYVQDMTLKELRKYKLDIGPNINNMTDEEKNIPTLSEYLKICKEKGLTPIIELRQRNYSEKSYQNLFKDIEQNIGIENCILMSLSLDIMQKLRSMSEHANLWYITNSLNDDVLSICKKYRFGVNVDQNSADLTKENVSKFRLNGISVGSWTLYDYDKLNFLKESGVDYITTKFNDINIEEFEQIEREH
ncbi:glycerophosphodiester phosphodiesterase family protein [Enterococcus alishanensis]